MVGFVMINLMLSSLQGLSKAIVCQRFREPWNKGSISLRVSSPFFKHSLFTHLLKEIPGDQPDPSNNEVVGKERDLTS